VSAQVTRIFRFDASGCNGCDIEVLEATTLVSLGELGIEIAERSDDANLLVVTGGSNLKSKRELEIAYNAMQAPKTVVAVGSCAATMGIFKGGYSMAGPIDNIVPVDLYISGCPPRPQVILGALADALHLKRRRDGGALRTPQGFRGDPHVDEAKCVGCGACAHVCPADAIEIVGTARPAACGSCTRTASSAVPVRTSARARPWSCVPDRRHGFRRKTPPSRGAACSQELSPLRGAVHAGGRRWRGYCAEWTRSLPWGASDRGMVERSLGICMQCRRKAHR